MPVQRIVRGKRITYRWGNTGMEYPTKQAAEEQGRAIAASSYFKKPQDKNHE